VQEESAVSQETADFFAYFPTVSPALLRCGRVSMGQGPHVSGYRKREEMKDRQIPGVQSTKSILAGVFVLMAGNFLSGHKLFSN